MTEPLFTDADKARLEAEGREALQRTAKRFTPVLLALLSGSPPMFVAALGLVGKDIGALISSEDARMVLRWLHALGHLSWIQLLAVHAWVALHFPEVALPQIDPNDPESFSKYGMPAMTMQGTQTIIDESGTAHVVGGSIPLDQTPPDFSKP